MEILDRLQALADDLADIRDEIGSEFGKDAAAICQHLTRAEGEVAKATDVIEEADDPDPEWLELECE